jgi:hypothetical protein
MGTDLLHAVAQMVEAPYYKPRFRIPMMSRNFSLIKSFRPHYGPGVNLAPNRNEYQEYFLRAKEAGA